MRLNKRDTKTEEEKGLKFLGRHVYETKQRFKKEADTLYKDKVLIGRARTRDLMPHIMNAAKLKSNLTKMTKEKRRD